MIGNVASRHGAGEIVDQVRLGASLGSSILRHAVEVAPELREDYFANVVTWDLTQRGLGYTLGDDFKYDEVVRFFGIDVTAELEQIRSHL